MTISFRDMMIATLSFSSVFVASAALAGNNFNHYRAPVSATPAQATATASHQMVTPRTTTRIIVPESSDRPIVKRVVVHDTDRPASYVDNSTPRTARRFNVMDRQRTVTRTATPVMFDQSRPALALPAAR